MVLAILVQFPTTVQVAVLVALPCAFAFFLESAKRRTHAKNYYHLGVMSQPKAPKRYFATAGMHGLSMGTLFALLALKPFGFGALGPVAQPVSFLLGAAFVAVFVYRLRMDYNGLLYKVGIPVLSLGLLIIALVPHVAAVGNAVYLIGYCFINVIMMCLNMYFVAGLGFSPVYIVGSSTLFLVVGEAVGIVAGSCLGFTFGSETAALLLGCGIAFMLPVASLYCLDERNMLSGWGSVKIDDSTSGTSRERVQQLVAAEYGLSTREAEVLELLARGNTRKAIARTLNLSEDTVKTYMRTLYAKLGVHTKQDVLDLLEHVGSAS